MPMQDWLFWRQLRENPTSRLGDQCEDAADGSFQRTTAD
jgi:hypothetical protein